jgi:hypothetical protein
MNHRMYAGKDQAFLDACRAAQTPATRRQYRKWCQRRGRAWGARLTG